QQRVVAGLRVACPGLLGQRDGPLGQAFEHEDVERAALGEFHGRLDPIARITGTAPETESRHAANTPNTRHAIVMRTEQAKRNGIVKRWCAARSMPARPMSRKVDGVSGLTGNPTVIWPSSAAWPMAVAGTPNVPATSAITGIIPK